MKKTKMFLMIGATVALLAMPVAATNLITVSNNSVQDQCKTEDKDAWYAEFLKIYKTDQAKASELAKKYLACPPAGEVTEAQQKIIDFLKKWSTAYDEGMRKLQLPQLLYNDKKYPEAYALGREILAKEPDNLNVLVHLGANGYVVAPLKNQQLTTESLDYARKALQLIESGKSLDDWAPLASKEAALAYLNFTIGTLTLEKEPANALKNLIKAAQYETPLKKSPFTYAYIAAAYETGPYAKQSEAYKATYGGKDETPESKLALANINQIVERMIDGYARAVALAGTDPQFAQQKTVWLDVLTNWYKYLHNNSDAGMTEYIAGVVAKPLPPEPTPLTVLPAAAPAASPATNTSGAAPTNGNGAATTTAPTGTTQPATKTSTPASSTSTKPAGTKPANPDRPRNRR
jgi:tetratricopeptide (TPR) repeat protein